MKKTFLSIITIVTMMSLIGCGCKHDCANADKDNLYQVSTLQALMMGYYDAVSTVGDLKKNGDIGIGCFVGVNGELIMLDGVVYQAIHDSTVLTPSDDTSIPYATVSFFEADMTETLENVADIESLKEQLDKIVTENGKNLFWFVRIDGEFENLEYRSEYEQHKPYKPLAKAMETDQTFFHNDKQSGTIVGLWCPNYMTQLNSYGWHFHFITADKKNGGHLLGVTAKNVTAKLDKTPRFRMKLSEQSDFQDLPLHTDMSKDMYEVETK